MESQNPPDSRRIQSLIAKRSIAQHTPEEGGGAADGSGRHPGIDRVDGIKARCRGPDDRNDLILAEAGLGLGDDEFPTLRPCGLEVMAVNGHQLGAAQRAGPAEEDKRPVPQSTQSQSAAGDDHGLGALDGRGDLLDQDGV